jgi:hypothetical protein
VAEQQDRLVDEPSRYNLAMTLAVLAAYQELRSSHDRVELLRALRAAFVEPLEPYVQGATRAMLDVATDPFMAMVQLTRDRQARAFGAGFVFTHPDDDWHRRADLPVPLPPSGPYCRRLSRRRIWPRGRPAHTVSTAAPHC